MSVSHALESHFLSLIDVVNKVNSFTYQHSPLYALFKHDTHDTAFPHNTTGHQNLHLYIKNMFLTVKTSIHTTETATTM